MNIQEALDWCEDNNANIKFYTLPDGSDRVAVTHLKHEQGTGETLIQAVESIQDKIRATEARAKELQERQDYIQKLKDMTIAERRIEGIKRRDIKLIEENLLG